MASTAEPPPQGGSDASGVRRVRLDLAYDGSGFHGFAENAGVRTVAGDLRQALERVLRQPVVLTCAGRTDTGVHARGQVVTFDVVGDVPGLDRLRDALNGALRPAVAVREVSEVAPDFDARFSARWRRYRYRVLDAPVHDPILASQVWWVGEPLDAAAMDAAATTLLGEHDFSSFCRRPGPEASLVRRVHAARWASAPASGGLMGDGTVRSFEITASAFCHQMVRSIVGALVHVGRGRMAPADVARLLASQDRSGAPNLAPPQGLTLWEVGYADWAEPQS